MWREAGLAAGLQHIINTGQCGLLSRTGPAGASGAGKSSCGQQGQATSFQKTFSDISWGWMGRITKQLCGGKHASVSHKMCHLERDP